MSVFSSITSKAFQSSLKAAPVEATLGQASATVPPAAASAAASVETVLSQMAAQKGGGGNGKSSIVDLLKLLDLGSSLSPRSAPGNELGVHAGAEGTTERNIALHETAMQMAKAPESMKG